ncbi:MAG TPA: hypothetical protein PK970_04495 [Hyphomicrobiaceae bacterium]|nr:hypothetical protein [Hyphomicrobiaceae bacterium]
MHRKISLVLGFLAVALSLVATKAAADFGKGPLPIAFEPPAAVALPADDTIVVEGTVTGSTPATIVLRIDDTASKDYATRMNDERRLPPGPFSIRIPTSQLRATNGRPLDVGAITRVIFFVHGEGAATVSRFALASGRNAVEAAASQSAAPAPVTTGTEPAPSAFSTGPLPIAFEPPAPVSIPGGKVIRIDGAVAGTAPVTLVLRVDDTATKDYGSRMNDERVVQPGPFSWRIETSRLRATNGRPLDPGAITRVILFVHGDGAAAVSRFDIAEKSDTRPAPPAPRVTAPPPRPKAAAVAAPRDFPTGRLPRTFEPPSAVAFADDDELVLEGTVTGSKPAAVALRIDDDKSTSYASRYNDERMLPPGPFRMTFGLKGLKTPSGRILDHQNVQRMFVFVWKDAADVMLTKFAIEKGIVLPPGAKGYSLGAADAPLIAGFERIAPGDTKLQSRGRIDVVRRPAPDPIVANGLRGVKTLALPAPKGRVRVTVWSEDPGEWEDLPRELDRRITVNGRDLRVVKATADDWIAARYLAGRDREHTTTDDAWTAYGRHRGHRRHLDIDATAGNVTIELSGSDPASYFLSAVLIEPLASAASSGDSPGQMAVEARRAEWYRNRYPVVRLTDETDRTATAVTLDLTKAGASQPAPIGLTVTPGTGARARLAVTTKIGIEKPRVSISLERPSAGPPLGARLWAGSKRLERDDTTLRLTDNFLRADIERLPLRAGEARTYEIWIDAPPATRSGRYTGHVAIGDGKRSQHIPLDVSVLPVDLPAPEKPAGFYHARAPHLTYFAGLAVERDQQVKCDLELFRAFGMTNTAPPVTGLDRTDLGLFATDMRRAATEGVAAGWLVYNPLHALLESQGPERAAKTVARLEAVTRGSGLPPPLWSVADEPSNPDQGAGHLADWIKALRAFAPSARLGGHLNTPSDETFVPLFDTLIVNSAFGMDAGNIARLTRAGKEIWYYNTFRPRFTAGYWLWATAATRYVQWHARMPTADPFDPLDGREADFQVLYPSTTVCPETPDIHRALLEMAEGIVDQRWLVWLSRQQSAAARSLVGELRSDANRPFEDQSKLATSSASAIRDRILRLVVRESR